MVLERINLTTQDGKLANTSKSKEKQQNNPIVAKAIELGINVEAYYTIAKPKNAGKDDITSEPLIQRMDDNEETIKNRLAIYHKQKDNRPYNQNHI